VTVRGPDGIVELEETLRLPSNVVLSGFTFRVTAPVTAIATDNFEEQTGSGSWFVDKHDVRHSFGLVDVQIVGNAGSNDAVSVQSADGRPIGGIACYGKRYRLSNVVVRNCVGDGLYTECGRIVGQQDWRDQPEAQIGPLWVKDCTGTGVRFRGPHNGHGSTIYPNTNGGAGLVVESGEKYSAAPFSCAFCHGYSNEEGNVFRTLTSIGTLVVDNERNRFAAGATIDKVRMGGGVPELELAGSETVVGTVKGTGPEEGPAVRISGNRVHVGSIALAKTPQGLVVDGDNAAVGSLSVREADVGLVLGDSRTVEGCAVDVGALPRCSTGIRYGGGGHNRLHGALSIMGDSAGFDPDGEPPAATDRFDLRFHGTGDTRGTVASGRAEVRDGDRIALNLVDDPTTGFVSLTSASPGVAASVDPGATDADGIGVRLDGAEGDGQHLVFYEARIGR
jgi:hypothetical protein